MSESFLTSVYISQCQSSIGNSHHQSFCSRTLLVISVIRSLFLPVCFVEMFLFYRVAKHKTIEKRLRNKSNYAHYQRSSCHTKKRIRLLRVHNACIVSPKIKWIMSTTKSETTKRKFFMFAMLINNNPGWDIHVYILLLLVWHVCGANHNVICANNCSKYRYEGPGTTTDFVSRTVVEFWVTHMLVTAKYDTNERRW